MNNKQLPLKNPKIPDRWKIPFAQSKIPLSSPGAAFMSRVFITSKGWVMVVAIIPADKLETKWVNKLSVNMLEKFCKRRYLNWSYIDNWPIVISAAREEAVAAPLNNLFKPSSL